MFPFILVSFNLVWYQSDNDDYPNGEREN